MNFLKTSLNGCYLIEYNPKTDGRGMFTRTFCVNEFKKHGIDFAVAQCNASFNYERGTLRGLHYQVEPRAEAKLVTCSSGAIYDVVLDLRSSSSTFKKWAAFELTSESKKALYIPKGFAHGFQTLAKDTEVLYWMSEFYDETTARGIRWNDPSFNILWPELNGMTLSEKDQKYLDYI